MHKYTPIVLIGMLTVVAVFAHIALGDETSPATTNAPVAIPKDSALDAAAPSQMPGRTNAPPIADMIRKHHPERPAKAEKPIELESVKAAQASNTPPTAAKPAEPTFQDGFRQGVMYGSVLRLRNQDADGPMLLNMALQAWYRDHPPTE